MPAPAPIGELVSGSFLAAVVEALQLGPPVVISPSLSGMYSLPFLTAPGSQLQGYVPVAPICTDKINAANYAGVKVSLLGSQVPNVGARESPSLSLHLELRYQGHFWEELTTSFHLMVCLADHVPHPVLNFLLGRFKSMPLHLPHWASWSLFLRVAPDKD